MLTDRNDLRATKNHSQWINVKARIRELQVSLPWPKDLADAEGVRYPTGHRRWILHTLFRTVRCSEASFKSKGVKKVFKIDSNLVSESARAMRSSTLPTRLNSFVSGDSFEGVVDMMLPFPNDDLSHCGSASKSRQKHTYFTLPF